MKVCFIGLGVMGYPMAAHVLKAGFEVCVYNRSRDKASLWLKQNPAGSIAETITQAVTQADVILSCIGKDDDLRQCAYGDDGIIANAKPGAVWVDHTTASAIVARELYDACKAAQLNFIDAPVSGGQSGAENGQLTVMTGGDVAAMELVTPLLNAYAKQVTHIGESGQGQMTKMVNQICLAGLIQGLSEGIAFAKKAGIDAEKVIEAIGKGAAQSWQMDNRAHTMINGEFDFGFAVDLMRKDLKLCLDNADTIGASLPVTALVDQFYAEVQANNGNKWDTSSLITRLDK